MRREKPDGAPQTEAERLLRGQKELLQHFDRMEYEGLFARYKAEHLPFFAALDADAAADAVTELLRLSERQTRFPWGKKLALLDLQRFFLLYLVPAALDSGYPAAAEFAERLRQSWNERWPDNAFGACTYQELVEGFRAKRPFGL